MKVSYFVIASPILGEQKNIKNNIKVLRSLYTKARKKLFSLDRKKNKKGKSFLLKKNYPILNINGEQYVVYGAIKVIRIQDILPLDISDMR